MKSASHGAVFTVYLNTPATGLGTADLIVAPRHDGLMGENVLTPLTPPNRLTLERLAAARSAPDPRVATLPGPIAGMLIGGDSRRFRFSERDIGELTEAARGLLDEGWSIAATLSRRTPARLAETLRHNMEKFAESRGASLLPLAGEGGPTQSGRMRAAAVRGAWGGGSWGGGSWGGWSRSGEGDKGPHPTPLRGATFSRAREKGTRAFLWDGEGENPYLSILACSDALLVTGDSVNMVSEAAATGTPVHVFTPGASSAKVSAFLDALEAHGAVRRWAGRVESWSYEPLDSTPELAREIERAYRRFASETAPDLLHGERRLRRNA